MPDSRSGDPGSKARRVSRKLKFPAGAPQESRNAKTMPPVIVITGTPGVGKSNVARSLAKRLNYSHLDISGIVERERLYKAIDKKRETLIADKKRLATRLRQLFGERARGFVVSTHYLDSLIPSRMVVLACVLRLDPTLLRRRLVRRGWARNKIAENVEAEVVGVCLVEAIDQYGPSRTCEIDSSHKSKERVIKEILGLITSNTKGRVKGKVGVVDWLATYQLESGGENVG